MLNLKYFFILGSDEARTRVVSLDKGVPYQLGYWPLYYFTIINIIIDDYARIIYSLRLVRFELTNIVWKTTSLPLTYSRFDLIL